MGAVAQHDHPVRIGDDLVELGGDHEQRKTVIAQFADQADDLGMGADIDAARRLVEHQQSRRGREPARQQHFLLVAAGEQPDRPFRLRRADVQELYEAHGDLVLLAARKRPEQAALGLQRQHDVFAHGQIGDDALGLALLGAIAETVPHGLARRLQSHRHALDLGRPGIGAFDAEHQPRRFGAARAEQPGEADHFAVAQREIERRDIAGLAVAFEARADVARLMRPGGGAFAGGLRKLAAQHHPDQFEARQRRGVTRSDQLAVAQDGDAIGDLVDLVEEMGDEDDADAARGELAHDAEQDRDLVTVETRGRLVEDQHPRRQIDGAGDRDDLLDRDRIVAKRRGHVDMKAEPGEQHAGSPAHLAFLNHAKPRRLAAEKQILRHRKIRQQVDLLIDGGDARIDRSLGRPRRDLDAVEANDARVAREHAGDHLDQGGFAGAVLAEQRMDFAGPQREVDTLQRAQRAKTLGDPANLQQRRRGIGALSISTSLPRASAWMRTPGMFT